MGGRRNAGPGDAPRRHDHLRLGADGEDRAAAWYRDRGYEVLDRNWRCPEGELDLVLLLGSTVVVCEVKTRSSDRFGAPAEAVGRTRQGRLRRAALQWLSAWDGPRPVGLRFDVASVRSGRVEVIEGAF